MEFLVRCSESKFILSKETDDYPTAVAAFYNNFCDKFFEGYDTQKFREERYWCEEVDFVYKSSIPLLKFYYNKYSRLNTLPGLKPFMSLQELRNMVNDLQLTEKVNEKMIPLIFN